MPRFAANLSLMFNEVPFLDRFDAAARVGFEACEFLFPYDFEPEQLRAKLDASALLLVLFNLSPGNWAEGERGLAALKGREADFEKAAVQAITYARALGCRQLHAMAGLRDHGADLETYIANLKRACALAAPHDITILIEPINTDDMPGYFLTQAETAVEVISAVDATNLRLQFDLYHRQKMQGDAIASIAKFADLTAHYQCAAPCDRGEPNREGLDYREVFREIDATGFQGWVGCEYRPRGRTEDGLSWRQELVC